MPQVWTDHPDRSIDLLESADLQLRPVYLRLDTSPHPDAAGEWESLVRRSAVFLELAVVASAMAEVLGFEYPEEVNRHEVLRRVRTLSGYDPERVLEQGVRCFPVQSHHAPDAREILHRDNIVRWISSVIEACPISWLEVAANHLRLAPHGHRCRVAYDALRAFIVRNDPRHSEVMPIVGRKYAEGSLSLHEAATILEVHPVDAIALLERDGYRRSIETVRLSDDARTHLLLRIREDRLARGGAPVMSPELAGRDTIASERMEGVDARSWIPRSGL